MSDGLVSIYTLNCSYTSAHTLCCWHEATIQPPLICLKDCLSLPHYLYWLHGFEIFFFFFFLRLYTSVAVYKWCDGSLFSPLFRFLFSSLSVWSVERCSSFMSPVRIVKSSGMTIEASCLCLDEKPWVMSLPYVCSNHCSIKKRH